jgi:beta-ribofuranosylaminobenzene 5'-phosphate synthase
MKRSATTRPATAPSAVIPPGQATEVVAPCRLHFGMLSFGQRDTRQFGGVGAMISPPGLRLSISPNDSLEVAGPGADRARQFIARLADRAAWWPARAACRVMIEAAPPTHAGLGSGTQLGMALAIGLAHFFGAPPQSAAELAHAVGRGRRSAIGVYGAMSGGLLVESGKFADAELSPLACRLELPDEWRFVLFLAGGLSGLSGSDEQRAFDQLPAVPVRLTEAMCREVLCELVPAAAQADFERFGESLYRYGRLAGECFAAAQGGVYASPRIQHLVGQCRQHGALGAGQSSWGPTVFALTPSPASAERLIARLEEAGELAASNTMVASPDNGGCQVTLTDGNRAAS